MLVTHPMFISFNFLKAYNDARLGTEWGNEDISDSVDDNDNGSILRISNIPTIACDAEMDRGQNTDVTIRGPKQKIGAKSSDQNDQVGSGKSDDKDEIFELAGTHREKQIEIFPMVGNGANATHDSLQCGEPNPNLITATTNIVPKGQFVGEPHTSDDRPVQRPKSRLKQHKFFHTNDAERQAAVNTGLKLKEMSTSKCLANTKYGMPAAKSSKKKAEASQAQPCALSPLVGEGTKRVFKCYDCRKLFPNELALAKHAKRHAKRGSYAKKRSAEKSGVKREDST
ncbi:unnamed protein product [Orchesella dallaii]|uniref:C2H2-type domain-containing protein n=1 Tax=Orchesella dallaii TaxID=48710 RepID=A0ABP1PUP5_9HEXA